VKHVGAVVFIQNRSSCTIDQINLVFFCKKKIVKYKNRIYCDVLTFMPYANYLFWKKNKINGVQV